jgi:hypothetical protein
VFESVERPAAVIDGYRGARQSIPGEIRIGPATEGRLQPRPAQEARRLGGDRRTMERARSAKT